MVTIAYTAAFTGLAETLGLDLDTDPAALSGMLDFGDELAALLGDLGTLSPVRQNRTEAVIGNATFTVTFHKRGDDLITVEAAGTGTILELDRLYEAGNATPVGLEVISGHQRLWIEGDLPDSFAEITGLVGDLVLGGDLLTALGDYSLERLTLVIEDPADGSLSFPAALEILPDGFAATILGYTLTARAPGATLDDALDLGQAVVGLVTGATGFRPLVRALDAFPPVDIGLAGPDGDEILGITGALADLLTPRRVQLDFTGDAGRDLFLGGAGRDRAEGAGGPDRLLGFGNDDELSGGAGRDRLIGGRGDDRVTGGAQADTFVFGRGHGDDRITDFGARDRLVLDDALWRAAADPVLDADQVVAQFADVVAEGVLLDFGARGSVLLEGLTDTLGLADSLRLA